MNDKMIEYNKIKIANCDNLKLMASMHDENVDVILTDPPYLYLKNQKLEREFDEVLFFKECARILSDDGFLVFFGRGVSFHRWNTIVDEIKLQDGKYLHISELKKDIDYKDVFDFKEEIVWDKKYSSSPLLPISRCHETISIFSKNNASINKVKVPYLEMKSDDINSVVQDVKRMKTILNNTKSLDAVLKFLELNYKDVNNDGKDIVRNDMVSNERFTKHGVNADSRKSGDRVVNTMQSISIGLNEKSIIKMHEINPSERKHNDKNNVVASKGMTNGDRCAYVMSGVVNGMNEKSIIKQGRDHYNTIHPTQKPVRLLERLLALVIPSDKNREDITVLDPFGGSFSTMEAVHNMGMKGISCEINKEYFDLGKSRIQEVTQQLKLF